MRFPQMIPEGGVSGMSQAKDKLIDEEADKVFDPNLIPVGDIGADEHIFLLVVTGKQQTKAGQQSDKQSGVFVSAKFID